jgi:hypothetical protein
MRSSFIFALLLAGPVAADEPGPSRDAYVVKDDPLGESVEKVVYLDQGWSPAVSLKFYFTSQGSQIIPYDWFLALEQADSQTLFRDNQNILKYRYLPQLPASNNPDGLPVGFVGDAGVGRRWLGLTCAACHTNEIRYGTTGYRVDGAPTQGDVRALLSALITAMQKTRDDPAKFDRFAAKVLGNQNSPSGQSILKERDGNNFPISRWLGNSAIVPFGKNFVKDDLHALLESRSILPAGFVYLVEEADFYLQSGGRFGLGHVVLDGLQRVEDHSSTRPGQMREQAVLNRIVLRTVRRVMGHADLDAQPVRQFLEVLFE